MKQSISAIMTLKASPLSNRGFDRREYPRLRRRSTRPSTLTGCPNLYIPLVVLHMALSQQSHHLVTCREFAVVLFLVDDILDNPVFICLRIGKGTIALLPFHKLREPLAIGRYKIVGGYFKVVNKRGYGDGWVESHKHVYMVGHTIDAVKYALVVFAKTIDIHIEVALVCLGNRCCALMSTEDNVVDELGICHISLVVRAPLQGAVSGDYCCPRVLPTVDPPVTERRRLQRLSGKNRINKRIKQIKR